MVELPERQPSEWRNHWARADSPMHEAQREFEKLQEISEILVQKIFKNFLSNILLQYLPCIMIG